MPEPNGLPAWINAYALDMDAAAEEGKRAAQASPQSAKPADPDLVCIFCGDPVPPPPVPAACYCCVRCEDDYPSDVHEAMQRAVRAGSSATHHNLRPVITQLVQTNTSCAIQINELRDSLRAHATLAVQHEQRIGELAADNLVYQQSTDQLKVALLKAQQAERRTRLKHIFAEVGAAALLVVCGLLWLLLTS